MKLTRRDALIALAGGTATSAVGIGLSEVADRTLGTDGELGENEAATLVALARTVYPSTLTGVRAFVLTYVRGLSDDRKAAMQRAINDLDRFASSNFGARFDELSASNRDRALRELGVGRVPPNPDGAAPARVRYYLVNQLLYALLTSPKGSRLFGIENPIGHPGGIDDYQEPP